MATQAELEVAVAALQAKKRRLQEALDRLVACSPVPIPIRWEDLDAHLASVAARLGCHLDSLHAAAATAAGDPTTADHHVQPPLEKDEPLQKDRARRGDPDWVEEEHGSNAEQGAQAAETASLDLEHGAEEGEEVPEEGLSSVASPREGDEVAVVEEEEAVNASAGHEGREDEAEWPRPRTAAGGAEAALTRAIAAACANMDSSALVDLLRLSGRSSIRARRAFLPALLRAADPHALIVRAVGGFLASAGPGGSRCWRNCVALIECVPRLAAPSAEALEQAERLAGRWKEMAVAEPASGRDLERMAGWGLLTFLASYGIVPEFDADELIRLFGNITPHMKKNCVDLCIRLGMIEKMNDSINHFIEKGKPLDAIRLAHTFSLTDKYPPLTIMTDYVENAKKTAEDILSMESNSLESLNQAMSKKVNALIFSWSAVDGCNIDPVHRSAIKAEITQLLHKYANKQQSLAGVSGTTSSLCQQQHIFQEQYQQQAQMQLVEQQQRKPEEEQQQQHQQQMPQEVEHQHIQYQQEPQEREQGWMWQNRRGKRQYNKNRKRKPSSQRQQRLSKRPRLSPYVRPGIHTQCGEPFSGVQAAPFCTRTRYFGPYYHSQPHLPVFRR
ncbi:hypothetical protein U9M48_009858 [Paspalum notatum var. saurae]|uniref:FRIGIDA-like protein n=1 Tax=Paspalum notatum var. saurae TaxID=547442 RepID=A0AAQ3WFJ5_PASNO